MEKMVSIIFAGTGASWTSIPSMCWVLRTAALQFMDSKYAAVLADIKRRKSSLGNRCQDEGYPRSLIRIPACRQRVIRAGISMATLQISNAKSGASRNPADHQGHEHGLGGETAGAQLRMEGLPAYAGAFAICWAIWRPGRTGDPPFFQPAAR